MNGLSGAWKPLRVRCRSMQPGWPLPRFGSGDVEDLVMRTNGFCVLAALALVSPALLTQASGQFRRGGGGGGPAPAPPSSAPAAAPRMAAPAPHMAARAPRFSAPAMPR